ncbi:MAG: hypothetical protein CL685_03630 [Candidatus Magasanikbacteria bacterium]|nr:hypothetical protein [Candidatus Magasanikbacteria bacterium]
MIHKIVTCDSLTSELLDDLTTQYATSFWSGSWQELLCVRESGNIMQQFGTFSAETKDLMTHNNLWHLVTENISWSHVLWEQAGQGTVFTEAGEQIEQFWTYNSAKETLLSFLLPTYNGGYGGEYIVLFSEEGTIIGFTAYFACEKSCALTLIQKRYPEKQHGTPEVQHIVSEFSWDTIGCFLDFAIAEEFQGKGCGSTLFDLRLNRLFALGVNGVVGRTISTSKAQYFGNYIKRGMVPLCTQESDAKKTIFFITPEMVKQRP